MATMTAAPRQAHLELVKEGTVRVSSSKEISRTQVQKILRELGIEMDGNEKFQAHFGFAEEIVPPATLKVLDIPREAADREVLVAYGEEDLERLGTIRIPLAHFLFALLELKKRGETGRFMAYIKGVGGVMMRVVAHLSPSKQRKTIGAELVNRSGTKVVHKHCALIAH